jgi:hypothetical protein
MILDRKISDDDAVLLLEKNGIVVSRAEAHIILDFLYIIAKNSCIDDNVPKLINRRRNRTL